MIHEEMRDLKRVLVVRLDNLGDVLMTGPALRALKEAIPSCELTLLASPGGALAAPLLPWIDRVVEGRALWQDLGSLTFDPGRERCLIDRLAAHRFDAAFIFTSFSQSPHPPGYVCYLAGIPIRIGASKEFGGGVLSTEIRSGPEEDGLHQIDRNLALLEALGIRTTHRGLSIEIPAQAEEELARILAAAGVRSQVPLIVACPWASCPSRTYPPEEMVAAASRLGRETGYGVALTGLPRHRKELEPLLALTGPNVVDLVGRLDLSSFAALVKRSELVLTNNSGPMHLAEACRTPMVVLYAGTDLESQWRPRNAPARLLRQPTPCHPCYAFTCEIGHPCLAIPVDEVVAAGMELVRAKGADAATA